MEINILVAFFGGLVSFFAPCVIPLLPAYIGYVTGVSLKDLKEHGSKQYRKQILYSSVLYVLGFSLVFVLLGTSAAGLGQLLLRYKAVVQTVGGAVIMLMALQFLGMYHVRFFEKQHTVQLPTWLEKLGSLRAFFVGVIFATAWTPCIGPVLGTILTLAASTSQAMYGALLLFVYSLGISLPFLFFAVLLSRTPTILKKITNYLPTIHIVAGVTLLVIGFLLFNNSLGLISDNLTYDDLNGWLFKMSRVVSMEAGLGRWFGI